jgi:hypothetical protein
MPGAPSSPPAPPYVGSLCLVCRHHRPVHTKTSTFILCTALPDKYPRQPMVTCLVYERAPPPQ